MDKKQVQMKQEIREYLNRTDHYIVLNISRDADDKTIKDSYRKLALRFHPDKNRTEGAKQVFKKISNAYSTLLNKQSRQYYDRHGNQPPQAHAHAHPGYEEYDDVFRAFYGFNNGFYFRRQNVQQVRGFNQMHLVILFVILFTVIPKLFEGKSYHSMHYTQEYSTMRQTRLFNAIYYVRNGFQEYILQNKNNLYQIEKLVDAEYLQRIIHACQNNAHYKRKYQQYVNSMFSSAETRRYYQEKIAELDLTACSRYHQLQQAHQSYFTQLYYS